MSCQINKRIVLTPVPDATLSQLPPCILPCHVKYSGPAPVADFFKIETTATNDHCEAYFRGRKLVGTTVNVPDQYTAVVYGSSREAITRTARQPACHSTRVPTSGDVDRERLATGEEQEQDEVEEVTQWDLKHKSNRMIVFGDSAPLNTEKDAVIKGLTEWIQLANIIHGIV